MSEKEQDFCPEDMPCGQKRSRRWFAKTGVGGAVLAGAAFFGLGGKRLLPQNTSWRDSNQTEIEEWIDRHAKDAETNPNLTDEWRQAIRERNVDFFTGKLATDEVPKNAADAADTCVATTQWCTYSNCSPWGKCVREYRCWSTQYHYYYYKDVVFACPSCPCPRM